MLDSLPPPLSGWRFTHPEIAPEEEAPSTAKAPRLVSKQPRRPRAKRKPDAPSPDSPA